MLSVLTEITLNDCFSLMTFFWYNDTGHENDLNLKCVRLGYGYILLTSVYDVTEKTQPKKPQRNV